jgi:hypothetical protein
MRKILLLFVVLFAVAALPAALARPKPCSLWPQCRTSPTPSVSPSPSPSMSPSVSPSPSPTPSPGPYPAPNPISGETPGWLVICDYSHSLPDDPIVFPGQPGASHLHDFLGARDVDAFSTYDSMRAGGTSCTATSGDTAGYWTPALYRNGAQILPRHGVAPPSGNGSTGKTREQVYYRNNLAQSVQTIPPGLRMIAGVGAATSPAGNPYLGRELYWGCSDNSTGKLIAPPASCATGIVTLHVGFPNCWDGVHLDSADHRSHMAYPVSGGGGYVCPSSHPVAIPRVITRWEYPVGTSTGTITLASGPTFTAHGDFWQTWDQPRLDELVAACFGSNGCGKV